MWKKENLGVFWFSTLMIKEAFVKLGKEELPG